MFCDDSGGIEVKFFAQIWLILEGKTGDDPVFLKYWDWAQLG